MCIGVHKRGKVKNEQPKRLWKILTVKWIKVKGNGHPRTGHEGTEGEQRYSSTLTLTSTLDGGGWSAPRPGRFTPRKDSVPIAQEAGWASGLVWTGAENFAPPPRRDSIPRLSSPQRIAIPTELSRPPKWQQALLIRLEVYTRLNGVTIQNTPSLDTTEITSEVNIRHRTVS